MLMMLCAPSMRGKNLLILCVVAALSVTFFVLKEPTSIVRALDSTPSVGQPDIVGRKGNLYRILCTTDFKSRLSLGSYKIRCLELKKWASQCAKNVRIDTGKILKEALKPSIPPYDATLAIKSLVRPKPQMGKVFIDVIDNYHMKEKHISNSISVIVQNEYQGLDAFPNRNYHVVQHMYNSYPDDFERIEPEFVPTIKPVDTLRMATVWSKAVRSQPCPQLSPSIENVIYECIAESWGIQNWYGKYMHETFMNNAEELRNHVIDVLSNPRLSAAKLYNELFYTFDVMVVPGKESSQEKLRWGSLQRTTSQMWSGVPTLVEAHGDAIRKFIEDYNYTCVFARPTESMSATGRRYWTFEEAAENLKSVELRQRCQQEGLEIAKNYSPSHIGQKMLRTLGYNGPFEC